MIKVENVEKPFINYVAKVIPLAFDESMSYYECVCSFYHYLKDEIMPTINNNAEATKELQELYVELEQYVQNYFKNLDVQEEINNKLDDMAEDGTLARIINEQLFTELNTKYTKAIINYDNINGMVEDETIEEGQIIYVMGDIEKGDGFSAYYTIVDSGSANGKYTIELDNGLYAVMQNEIEENYYKEVYYEMIRTQDTDCYFTYIPYEDNNEEQIPFVVSQAGNDPLTNAPFSPNEHARYYNTTFTSNASLSLWDTDHYVDGSVISNGTIIRDIDLSQLATNEYEYIGFKEDRSVAYYQANITSAQDMLDDGVKNAVLTFGRCVNNGTLMSVTEHYQHNDIDHFIGVKANKDIIILTCDGRNSSNKGLNYQTGGNMLIAKGCQTVFMLDSGGSASVSIKGTKINLNYDDDNRTDRKIPYLFDVKKTIVNKALANAYSYLGQTKQTINTQLLNLINKREPLRIIGKFVFSEKSYSPQATANGDLIDGITGSSPNNSLFQLNNGVFSFNFPDSHTSLLPYQIKIHGHIVIHNTTGANTSHIINVMENDTVETYYRQTIGNDDYATFTIDETLNNVTSTHTYSLRVYALNPNNTQIVKGNIVIEYIPKDTSYIPDKFLG